MKKGKQGTEFCSGPFRTQNQTSEKAFFLSTYTTEPPHSISLQVSLKQNIQLKFSPSILLLYVPL